MKLYQYIILIDLLKEYYFEEMSMIIDLDKKIRLAKVIYGTAEFIEKKLSSNNTGYITFQFITGSLIFPYKMDNGKEVNSVEEMFFELCKGGDGDQLLYSNI